MFSSYTGRSSMQLKELVREWMQKVRQDLDSAKILSGMKPMPEDFIGFHSQLDLIESNHHRN